MAATQDYEHNMVLATTDYEVVGTRPIRHDGVDKVTGRALYGADFNLAGLLHGKILRSPHAHARIKSIDTSKAEAHPGVRAVVTGADLAPAESGISPNLGDLDEDLRYLRENILARDKALYKGHAVAAVAAVSPHDAEEAIYLIEVEYEELPPVLTAPEAMKADAALLLDDLKTKWPDGSTGDLSNLSEHIRHEMGDVEKGFAEADVVIEREFNTATVHQGYIEPHNAVALWNNDGRLEIWCSTQGSFTVRDTVGAILDLPVSQIRVTPMEIGGGFGGKIAVYLEPVAALLSKKTGHPVKMVMGRDEVFEGTGPTPGSYIKVKMGATREGQITAAQAYMAYEAGPFPGSSVNYGSMCIFSSYDIPNVLIDGYDVVVNKPKTRAYRAPGATNACFASETVLDEIVERLGLDPLEFRLGNASKEGTRRAGGPVFPRIGCVEIIEAMRSHPHYTAPLDGPNRGRGVAVAFWYNIGFISSCTISVNTDGTVNLVEGSTDIGGTRTSVAMQAAEVLGLRADEVYPKVVDTDSIGYTAVTAGSRVAFSTGYAAYEAAQDVKRQMVERAARIWEIEPESVEFENGVFQSRSDPALRVTFKELAKQLSETGGPITGQAVVTRLSERALELVPRDTLEEARLLSIQGGILGLQEGDYEGAHTAFDRAMAIARREKNVALEVATLANAAFVDLYHLRPKECLERSSSAIALARHLEPSVAAVAAHFSAAAMLWFIGETQRIGQHAEAALAVAEKLRDRSWLGRAFFANESVPYSSGDWDTARTHSDRSQSVSPSDVRGLLARIVLEYEVGDYHQGEVFLERALDIMRSTPPGPTLEQAVPAVVISIAGRISGVTDRFDIAEESAAELLSSPFLTPLIEYLANPKSTEGMTMQQRNGRWSGHDLG